MSTRLVFVYGGCETRGIAMSRAVMLGFAFLWDAIGAGSVESVDWFLADDPSIQLPPDRGFQAGSLRTQLAAEHAAHLGKNASHDPFGAKTQAEVQIVMSLAGNARVTWNDKANKFAGWTARTVRQRIAALGNGGKDRVILVLVGHGSSGAGKDGAAATTPTVSIDTKSPVKEDRYLTGAHLCEAAMSCKSLLAIVGACYGDALFKGAVLPPQLATIASAASENQDDHGHLQAFLVAIGWALEVVVTEFPARCRVTFSGLGAWLQALVTERFGELQKALATKRYACFQNAHSIAAASAERKITAIVRHHASVGGSRVMSMFHERAEEVAQAQEEVMKSASS